MDYLARRPEFLGRVGFLGLSVGGHIGYLAATRLDLAACAIFYAGWLSDTGIPLSRPEPTLDLTPGIAEHGGRILYLVGGKDAIVSAQQREDIAQALTTANVRHELVVYPEAKHGFFCEDRDTYDPAAAADAWQRTIALLSSELRK
jgi:carboxymethylenebutenolidase